MEYVNDPVRNWRIIVPYVSTPIMLAIASGNTYNIFERAVQGDLWPSVGHGAATIFSLGMSYLGGRDIYRQIRGRRQSLDTAPADRIR